MIWRQVFATLTVNLLTLAFGISIGWAAPNTILFQSEQSPIGIMSSDQISLIASILCIGGIAGTVIFGSVVDIWGRKLAMISIALPQIVGNVLLLFGTHYYHIYTARFLFGLAAGGVYIMVPIFVSEISSERVRGALGTFMCLMYNSGIVVGYILASWMNYFQMPYVAIGITMIFLAVFVWLPESPDFLAHINKIDEAKLSYKFYGNNRVISQAMSIEAPTIKKSVGQGETTMTSSPADKNTHDDDRRREKISWADFTDKAVQRGIVLSITLILFADTTGVFAIQHFMTELFESAEMEIDIYLATVGVGIIQILGSIISLVCIDRFGRRVLFMVSAGGTGSCLFVFGTYYHLLARAEYQDWVAQIRWLPLVSVCGVILIAACAVASLPFFIISELMPLKVRGFVVTMCLVVSWIFAFGIVQYYHAMVEFLGIAGTMWTYGTCCILEIFFVYFFLPETKNLTFDEIQAKLRKL